jgi:hypothetical protein
MSTLKLPEPIAAYFAADKLNPEAVARCFTAQAVVMAEERTHTGIAAIKAWKAAASTAYAYTVEPFALDQKESSHIVRSRVTGNFSASPVDLQYDFRLERGLIASLEITA